MFSGYGVLNHQDRAMIVSIILGLVIVLRIIQVICIVMNSRSSYSSEPIFFTTSPVANQHYYGPKSGLNHSFENNRPVDVVLHNTNSAMNHRIQDSFDQGGAIRSSKNIHL